MIWNQQSMLSSLDTQPCLSRLPVSLPVRSGSTLKMSVDGAMNRLGLAIRADASVNRASKSDACGDSTVRHQVRGCWGEDDPLGTTCMLRERRQATEMVLNAFRGQDEMDTCIMHIFNV